MLKAYIAGPTVFKENAKEIFESIKTLCGRNDIIALTPLDNDLQDPNEIYVSNLKLIREADLVIADLTSFRSCSCDPGTAYEMGYAKALGKPIYSYSGDMLVEYKNRVIKGGEFPIVENFGLHDNLMIACGVRFHGKRLYQCLEFIRSEQNRKTENDS